MYFSGKLFNMVAIGDIFGEMAKLFKAEAAGTLKASYQFEITGPEGGTWALDIQNGACQLVVGGVPEPSVTISLADSDWLKIREGKLNSQMAFMQGRLKIKGDMNLAMRLQSMFPIS